MRLIDLVKVNLDKKWDFSLLSENPNINWKDVEGNPEIPFGAKYRARDYPDRQDLHKFGFSRIYPITCVPANPADFYHELFCSFI